MRGYMERSGVEWIKGFVIPLTAQCDGYSLVGAYPQGEHSSITPIKIVALLTLETVRSL